MIQRLFGRKTTRNSQVNRRRRRTTIRVQQLENRRLFAADAFSFEMDPSPPVEGPSDVAAEVSTAGDSVPQDSFSINFAKIEFQPQEGQDGNDLLIVNNGDGSDFLEGEDGSDVLRGGAGNDTLLGNRGNDIVLGEAGSDLLIVNNGDGSDFLEGRGGAGNDTRLGNRGNDIVLGQDGNDLLIVNNGDGSDF